MRIVPKFIYIFAVANLILFTANIYKIANPPKCVFIRVPIDANTKRVKIGDYVFQFAWWLFGDSKIEEMRARFNVPAIVLRQVVIKSVCEPKVIKTVCENI